MTSKSAHRSPLLVLFRPNRGSACRSDPAPEALVHEDHGRRLFGQVKWRRMSLCGSRLLGGVPSLRSAGMNFLTRSSEGIQNGLVAETMTKAQISKARKYSMGEQVKLRHCLSTMIVAVFVVSGCSDAEVEYQTTRVPLYQGADNEDATEPSVEFSLSPQELMFQRLRVIHKLQQENSEAIVSSAGEAVLAELNEFQSATGQPLGAIGVAFDRRGNVKYLHGGQLGLLVDADGSTPMEKALSFVADWSDVYQCPDIALEPQASQGSSTNQVRFQQMIGPYPVFESDIVLTFNLETLRLKSVAGTVVPVALAPTAAPASLATFQECDAVQVVESKGLSLRDDTPVSYGIADPLILKGEAGTPEFAWKVPVEAEGGLPYLSFVSAASGSEIARLKQYSNSELLS
ncbi:MAG: hypothetical protein HN341_13410 [Verrucomicrobia bacterium]|nr:hypothetical protein [Verrucomicrobiota bacterium]